jgi:hypothetical protein
MSEERAERRPTELLLAELEVIRATAQALGIESPTGDFDVGLTTDDLQA